VSLGLLFNFQQAFSLESYSIALFSISQGWYFIEQK